MRGSFFHMLIALFTCFALTAAARQDDDALQSQIRNVETGLPPVVNGGRTLRFSLQEWMQALGVPGVSIAVIDHYKIAWAKGYGVLGENDPNEPVTAHTLFQAASITKPVTALALLHYVELGSFDLDADINEYLRSWKLPESSGVKKVTLRDLLAHSAGITPGGFAGYQRGAPLPTITQILDGEPPASNRPAQVVSPPGSTVSYSGLGYMMIQLALTDHLGKPFDKIVRTSVLDPIGMRESTFGPPPRASAALGHFVTGKTIPGGWQVFPELAAAGLWSTPSDLARMAIDVATSVSGTSNHVLSAAMTRKMLTQHREEMGLGFVIRPEDPHGYFAHSGGNQGYRCHFEMLSETGQGIVVMTNSDAGRLIILLLMKSVAQVYHWPSDERQPVSAALANDIVEQLNRLKTSRKQVHVNEHILAGYAGRYELAPGFVFDVALVDGHLEVKLGEQPRFPVYPESETEFFYEIVDAQITFVQNDAGKTVSLILHQNGRDQEAKRIK